LGMWAVTAWGTVAFWAMLAFVGIPSDLQNAMWLPISITVLLVALTLAYYARSNLPRNAEWSVLAPAMGGGYALAILIHTRIVFNALDMLKAWRPFQAGSVAAMIVNVFCGFLVTAVCVFVAAWLSSKSMDSHRAECRTLNTKHWLSNVGLVTACVAINVAAFNMLAKSLGPDSNGAYVQSLIIGCGRLAAIVSAVLVSTHVIWRQADLTGRWMGIASSGLWVMLFVSGDLFPWWRAQTVTEGVIRAGLIGGAASLLSVLYVWLVVASLVRRVKYAQR